MGTEREEITIYDLRFTICEPMRRPETAEKRGETKHETALQHLKPPGETAGPLLEKNNADNVSADSTATTTSLLACVCMSTCVHDITGTRVMKPLGG